jgi:beta-lactamase regulating signal transducer with metallopeptidase domain
MNTFVEILNRWAENALNFAWPAFWQSSLLIGVLFCLDLGLRRRLRAAVLYGLWLTVLVKLLLPPSLAFPSGVGWWLRSPADAPVVHQRAALVVTYAAGSLPSLTPQKLSTPLGSRRIRMSLAAWGLVASSSTSLGLLLWMFVQSRRVRRYTRHAVAPPHWLPELLNEACHCAELRHTVRLGLINQVVSPAVCGLFRPTILLPLTLIRQLNVSQMRAILLHEVIHVRRGDVWISCLQALLQIIYWWHPLLWLANTRIRHAREEAVDDAVMSTLRCNCDVYAPTLVQVAKLVMQRPLARLGLVGILESHGSFRRRIERLLDFRPPRKPGLTLVSAICIVAFGAVALPMGQAPATHQESASEPQFIPNVYSRTNLSHNAARRTAIFTKLDTIRFDRVEFDNLPLSEVIRFLSEETRKLDSAQRGINFMIRSAPNHGDSESARAELGDVSTVRIKILPALVDVRVADVLDAIVKVADKPIKYFIEDYAVIFAWKVDEPAPLYTRILKVDPDSFEQALEHVTGFSPRPAGASSSKQALAAEFFRSVGVDLRQPRSLVYNDREGTLLIRATLADLDIIESAVQVLNTAPPQVNIIARFFAVPEELTRSVWLLLGPTNQPNWVASNLSTVLTPPQAAVFLKAMESAQGVKLLNECSVTTLSGRQAQIQTVDLFNVATNVNPRAFNPPGVSTNAGRGDGLYMETTIPLGPVLDVVAWVSADGSHIQLTANATMTEFLGYDQSTNFVRAYVDGKQKSVPVPLPHIKVRQMNASAIVYDGQALVVGSPISGAATAGTPGEKGKRLMAILTATIIDPAGNPIHNPFSK